MVGYSLHWWLFDGFTACTNPASAFARIRYVALVVGLVACEAFDVVGVNVHFNRGAPNVH